MYGGLWGVVTGGALRRGQSWGPLGAPLGGWAGSLRDLGGGGGNVELIGFPLKVCFLYNVLLFSVRQRHYPSASEERPNADLALHS